MKSRYTIALTAGITALALFPVSATIAADIDQPDAPPVEEDAEAATNAANSMVCRRMPAPSGTRIGSRRVCRTQAEWTALQRESRGSIERAQGAGTYGNSGRSTATYGPGNQ